MIIHFALLLGILPYKDAFIQSLISNMTIEDLVLQLHLTFGGDIIGGQDGNELYDHAMRFSPDSPIGVVHDWYSLNTSHYNSIQEYNLEKAHLKIPLVHTGECLHGVASFKQSMFPQSLSLSASFDTDLVYRVGRAIGAEARSIGIHACFSPVLDIGQDPRWGRMQEAWGEDKVLTSRMGVAYASGLSKNSSWSEPDAVVPVVKHFAAHGSPQSGHNGAPFMGYGNRQLVQDLLTPFKAAIQLGGAKGVMMAYNEFDGIPAHVHPMFYEALKDWGYTGFVMADDTGMSELETIHRVADSPADTIRQWFNAGGMLQFYDHPLETYLNLTKELIANGSVQLSTLQSRVKAMLGVKWDLGLFRDPFIPPAIDPVQIVHSHRDLALEAARKSLVLLENRNATLPFRPKEQGIRKIALIGPFADVLNYGDYSGPWGQTPADDAATTLRQGMLEYAAEAAVDDGFEVLSSWGANTWEYNAQYVIPPYLLFPNDDDDDNNTDGGGLSATYFADTDFTTPITRKKKEVPALDWGLYPPAGLPSTNFSAVWEGWLASPVDYLDEDDVHGWIGVAVGADATARLFVDDELVFAHDGGLEGGTIMPNIVDRAYVLANGTRASPAGSAPFVFRRGARHVVRLEVRAYDRRPPVANVVAVRSRVLLFWNLVDRRTAIQQAARLARAPDVDAIVLALGAAWNSDGENADRALLGLAPAQAALARAVYDGARDARTPVVLVLQGGRPFALGGNGHGNGYGNGDGHDGKEGDDDLDLYARSAAVLSAGFAGQAGGRAIADALFGAVDPAGRLPVGVPRHAGQLPVHYQGLGRRRGAYVDADAEPAYWFGHGLSYATFAVRDFSASTATTADATTTPAVAAAAAADRGELYFGAGDTVAFSVRVANAGAVRGSFVAQVYLLSRVSSVVQPARQLVAFGRVDVEVGGEATLAMELDVDRYLTILNRTDGWELEKGPYTFALLRNGGDTDSSVNVTLHCV
ncbi:family 3 glycoside hydrolase [Xylariaceae sp. FL0804]|nr:family 3 glycoside hydrolase [Xylariaceae sp. FL0804]